MEGLNNVLDGFCDICIGKTTTFGCFNCQIKKLKKALQELQNKINEIPKNDLKYYKLLINKRYQVWVLNVINLRGIDYSVDNTHSCIPNNTTSKELAILWDTREFLNLFNEWGDKNE